MWSCSSLNMFSTLQLWSIFILSSHWCRYQWERSRWKNCPPCNKSNLPVVKYLIEEAYVGKDAKDEEGKTALHYASEIGHLDVVEYLIEEAHADKESKDNEVKLLFE